MTPAVAGAAASVLDAVRVGTLELDHRLVVPPHGGGRGSLLGSPEQFEKHCAYWLARVEGGMRWVGGGPGYVRNPLIPGFETSGVGAHARGIFRDPRYVERQGELSARIRRAGGYSTVQLVLQGGMPLAPSPTLSGYLDHAIPHVLDPDEIATVISEYAASARLAAEAGVDVIELHAAHDDLLQWFLSPRTNQRTDGWGGDLTGRRRFLREVVAAIRADVDRPLTLGLRLCLDERIEGGHGVDDCRELVAAFTADGEVDYFSVDVGNNWGAPSYVPTAVHDHAAWAPLAAPVTGATHLPVMYVGLVPDLGTADGIVRAGQADLVGMVRAAIADPRLVAKTRAGRSADVRPCVVMNDCIDRVTGEGLPFACAVNPEAGHEQLPAPQRTRSPRDVLVVGGGPAGTEFAALSAERGHRVTLLERADHLGGQLAVAARARMNHRYGRWIEWQQRRLAALGVVVRLRTEAVADELLAAGADVLAVATGARPRTPTVAGVDAPHVLQGVDVLRGHAVPGHRVVVVSEDDRGAPLAVADHLAGAGHDVTVVYSSPAPSPQLSKYSNGSVLARLDAEGARMVPMARLTAIEVDGVELAHTYSGRRRRLDGVDSVVLACGSVADDTLHRTLRGHHPGLHVLGDAYAPRRVSFATRQAWALARELDDTLRDGTPR